MLRIVWAFGVCGNNNFVAACGTMVVRLAVVANGGDELGV
jgi:hypothetical protein